MRPQAAWLARSIDASNVSFDTTDMSSGQRVLVSCFLGAALWNAVCMVPLIFLTFKSVAYQFLMTLLHAERVVCLQCPLVTESLLCKMPPETLWW